MELQSTLVHCEVQQCGSTGEREKEKVREREGGIEKEERKRERKK